MDRQNDERRRELGVSDDLTGIAGLTSSMLVTLGENGIVTLDDLGDLASDELIELLGEQAPSHEEVDTIIMAARAHWFEDEAPSAPAEGEAESADEGEPPVTGTEPEGAAQAGEAKEA